MSTPYVGFLLGGAPFALPAARILAVAPAAGVIQVPFMRSCMAGVLVRRGRLVPVADLARVPSLWNIVPAAGGDQVLVLGTGEIEAGFLASAVETFRAETETASGGETGGGPRGHAAPSGAGEAILSGTLRGFGRAWGLLRVDAALAAAGFPAQSSS